MHFSRDKTNLPQRFTYFSFDTDLRKFFIRYKLLSCILIKLGAKCGGLIRDSRVINEKSSFSAEEMKIHIPGQTSKIDINITTEYYDPAKSQLYPD